MWEGTQEGKGPKTNESSLAMVSNNPARGWERSWSRTLEAGARWMQREQQWEKLYSQVNKFCKGWGAGDSAETIRLLELKEETTYIAWRTRSRLLRVTGRNF